MTNLEVKERLEREKLEAKILLEVLENLKPILEKYKGKKVLKVNGSPIKALLDEVAKLYYNLEKKYNNDRIKIQRFYLIAYGIYEKGFQLNFCLKHKAIKHGKMVEYYTKDDQHHFATITDGILIDLNLEALEKHFNTVKNYNIRSVLSKFKKVNNHIAKIEEIGRDLPYYLKHEIKLWQPYF